MRKTRRIRPTVLKIWHRCTKKEVVVWLMVGTGPDADTDTDEDAIYVHLCWH
jgi:hypothetical protein